MDSMCGSAPDNCGHYLIAIRRLIPSGKCDEGKMNAIGVVIADGVPRVFWRALAEALEKEPTLQVFHARSPRVIRKLLRRNDPRVLIIDSQCGKLPIDYRVLLDEYPHLTVIDIDTQSTDLTLTLKDVGLDQLVQLIRTAARSEPSSQSNAPRLHIVDSQRMAALSVAQNTDRDDALSSVTPSDLSEGAEGLSLAIRWLRHLLGERVAQEEECPRNSDTPLWGVSIDRAKRIFSPDMTGSSAVELRRERVKIEHQLFSTDQTPTRFRNVCEAFDLTLREGKALLIALAPEFDGRFAGVFSFLNNETNRRYATPSLLAELLGEGEAGEKETWHYLEMLSGRSTLCDHGLITLESSGGLPASESALVASHELLEFLLNPVNGVPHYAPYITVLSPPRPRDADTGSTDDLRGVLLDWDKSFSEASNNPVMQLVGEGMRQWFEHTMATLGDTVVVCNLAAIDPEDGCSLAQSCLAAVRVARMHCAALLIAGRESLPPQRRLWFDDAFITELARRTPRMAVFGQSARSLNIDRPVRLLEYPQCDVAKRSELWSQRARAFHVSIHDEDLHYVATTVQFREPQIDATLRLCQSQTPDRRQLQAAILQISRADMPPSVRRVESTFAWADLVLPENVMNQVRSIGAHVRYSSEVMEAWGYRNRMPYGQGVAALFCGPSGTGKTMTSQIIARDLGVDLLHVDLSKTVSKFIGETETNLEEIFCAAEKSRSALLFDEAESLFTKRTEVRDAHDRYANVEVAYLLQRMERFSGLAVLTTNLGRNLDSAFLRRLRFVVEFPAPTALERQAIWNRVFPHEAPLAKDVDFTYLANRIELTGGHIQQIAVCAAFLAMSEGEMIHMRHIVEATREELRKLGMGNAEKSLSILAA